MKNSMHCGAILNYHGNIIFINHNHLVSSSYFSSVALLFIELILNLIRTFLVVSIIILSIIVVMTVIVYYSKYNNEYSDTAFNEVTKIKC